MLTNNRATSFIFFFSSRRRHTRSLRDWSSDVCSSDLAASPERPWRNRLLQGRSGDAAMMARLEPWTAQFATVGRSEERRVGKEGRTVLSAYLLNENSWSI